MREAKRVLSPKWLLSLILILLLNAFIIIKDNYSDSAVSRVYDEMVKDAIRNKKDNNTNFEAATLAWQQYFHKYSIDINQERDIDIYAKEARKILMDMANYVDDYKQLIQSKKENALRLLKSGIYSVGCFEYLNLQKTNNDLSESIKADVSVSNGIWLKKLYNHEYLQFFGLILSISIVYGFLAERKDGLYFIVHATKDGRGKLFVSRYILLSATVFVVNCILYLETAVLLITMHGGIEGLNIVAASDESFLLTAGLFTRLEFVGLLIVLSSIANLVLSSFMWFILSIFCNGNIGMFIYIIIGAIDLLLYVFIIPKSILRVFHFINVYYFLFPNRMVSYYNWGYSYGIMSLLFSTIVFALVMGIILFGVNYHINIHRYYTGRENRLELRMGQLIENLMQLLGRMPVVFIEMYKIFFPQKVGIVLALLFYIVTQTEAGPMVYYDAMSSFLSAYYERAEGLNYGLELEEIYDDYFEEYNAFVKNIDLSTETSESILSFKNFAIMAIRDNVDYLKQMDEKGISVVVLKPYEYEGAFGLTEGENQRLLGLINVIAAIAISGGFICYEKKCKMLNMVRAYRNRQRWLIRKFLGSFCLMTIFTSATYGVYYYKLFNTYAIREGMSAPLKSLPMFQDYPVNPSIGGLLLLDLVIKIILLACISVFICYISLHMNYLYCVLVGMIIVVPQLLYYVGFEALDNLSIGKYIAFFPLLWEGKNGLGKYYIFIISLMLFSSILFFKIKKGVRKVGNV